MQNVKEEYQNVDDEVVIDTPRDWRKVYNARQLLDRGDFLAAWTRIGDVAMAL